MPDNALVLRPATSAHAGETHAALVISTDSFGETRFAGNGVTLDQLREGSEPNPWETAWAIFGYEGPDEFYYLAFKTNGWELGKTDPAYGSYNDETGETIGDGGQRYLDTGTLPNFAVDEPFNFSIRMVPNYQGSGSTFIRAKIDGQAVSEFLDEERPYDFGSVGWYSEDAEVALDNVSGSVRDNFNYTAASFNDGDVIGNKWRVVYDGDLEAQGVMIAGV